MPESGIHAVHGGEDVNTPPTQKDKNYFKIVAVEETEQFLVKSAEPDLEILTLFKPTLNLAAADTRSTAK